MGNINGPGIFLAQFLRDEAPFNNLESICKWAADLGYKGVQIPTWDKRVFDLATASESKVYCDEINGMLKNHGLQITELASHLQGQVLAMSNVYKKAFSGFYPADLNSAEITEWAADQLMKSIKASVNLGVNVIPVLSGGFAWHLMYPWPQRPPGIIDEAFQELSNRWIPVLNYAA